MEYFSLPRKFLNGFLTVLLAGSPLFAGWSGSAGEASFDFFGEFSPAEVRSLGGAGVALINRNSSWFLNPAVLPDHQLGGSIDLSSDAFGGRSALLNASYRMQTLSLPVAFRMVLGLSQLGTIDERDELNHLTGVTHSPQTVLLATGLAWRFNGFEIGHTVGLATDRLTDEGEVALGFWIDMGIRYQISRRATAAAALRRYGRRLNSYIDEGDPSGKLPAELVVGAAWVVDPKGKWKLATDWITRAFGEPSAALGVEWSPLKNFRVRAGGEIDLEQLKWIGNQITDDGQRSWRADREELFGVGVGWSPSAWGVDYSLTLLRDGAGAQHSLSIRYTAF